MRKYFILQFEILDIRSQIEALGDKFKSGKKQRIRLTTPAPLLKQEGK
jgi:hypothetical protein